MLHQLVVKETTPLFEMGKTCKRCREVKPDDAFHMRGPGMGRMAICGDCRARRRRDRGERRRAGETSEQRRVRLLWEEYRLRPADYEALLEVQGGVCAMCGKAPRAGARLVVDHCHTEGFVRALLCTGCNVAVGVYENHHRAASAYLATYGAGNPLLRGHTLSKSVPARR
jgi:hypothetical protein